MNGRRVGAGEDANKLFRFDVSDLLKPGTHLLAVTAFNAHAEPNPASLIGNLTIQFRDAGALEVNTDARWESAVTPPAQWRDDPAASGWRAAMEVGALGMELFPVPKQTRPPAYVFPDFGAITNVLGQMGVPPDFEADPSLRYLHRRAGSTDIYFVPNRSSPWCGATCAFRVAGKVSELWNPLTGEIRRPLVYEARDGRSVLPLWLEPAGSVFVVFRESSAASPERIIAATRDGRSMLPDGRVPSAEPPPAELIPGPANEITLLA